MKIVPLLLVTALAACSSSHDAGDDTVSPDGGSVDAGVVASPDLGKFCPMGCNLDTCVDTAATDCESHDCVWDGRGDDFGDAYCSQSCASAGCPDGYTCLAAEDGTGKFCFADPAVCGDGVVERGEKCDAGSTNGAPDSGCAADCMKTLDSGHATFKYDGAPIDLQGSTSDGNFSSNVSDDIVTLHWSAPYALSLGITLSKADLVGPFPKLVTSRVGLSDLQSSWCFDNPGVGTPLTTVVTVTGWNGSHITGSFDGTMKFSACSTVHPDPAVKTRVITQSSFDAFFDSTED
jgi:hypothetical protein